MPQPSYAELVVLFDELRSENAALRAEVVALRAEVADLKSQLSANSGNSSRPPSSDGLAKPSPKSLRGKSGRKPGGQDGHLGSTLMQVATPDEILVHEPSCCTGCGHSLTGVGIRGVEKRQVFDLPTIKVTVTEHQLVSKVCACGVLNRAVAPAGVDAPVQYGPLIRSVMVYLYVGQFLSKARTATAVAELFNIPVSAGTVSSVTARAARGLTGFLNLAKNEITAAPVAHFDETGMRIDGRLGWIHSASTPGWSLLVAHRKRGTEAMNALGVLPGFTGVAMHDAWAPYDTYTHARHVLCNAHLLRELQAVIDTHHGGGWCWASQVRDSLLTLKTHADTIREAHQPAISPRTIARLRHQIRLAAVTAAADNTPGALGNKHRALARRIRDRLPAYLMFATNLTIPFDNNAAEREIRMVKIRQKVSGCARTMTGAQHFCAIRSYIATTAKHGIKQLDALHQLTAGQPWLPDTT